MTKRKHYLIISILCLFNCLCLGQEASIKEVSLKPLPNAYGQIIDMTEGVEAGVVLIFTNHTCLYSKLYVDRLNGLNEMLKNTGVKLIAIESKINSLENTVSSLDQYLQKASISYTYLIDLDNVLANDLGAESSPHAFLLKKSNETFQIVYDGSIDNNSRKPDRVTRDYLKDAIEQMLNGEEIVYSNSKPIGCNISN